MSQQQIVGGKQVDEWWTDTTVKTDSEGEAVVEAFKGNYCFEADGYSSKAGLSDNEPMEIRIV